MADAATSSPRPLVLLSNDDGFQSHGIQVLFQALATFCDVHLVAPLHDQSASSHALSLHRSLRHQVHRDRVHSVDGTPADCIYVGLFHPNILPRWPDIVVAGLNHGPNLGSDVHYSGTVAAAREGALRNIPSIAFSAADDSVMAAAMPMCARMVQRLFAGTAPRVLAAGAGAQDGFDAAEPFGSDSPQTPFLNVNFPAGTFRGVRSTRLGERSYRDEVTVRQDPRGRGYLWLGGPGAMPHRPMEGADTEAVDAGFVSVTPLRVAVTHPAHFGIAAYVAGAEEPDGGA